MHLACGRYEHCTFERGPMAIRKVGTDPAFEGLPDEFTVMESHCGQIEVVPRRWRWIATNGPKGLTRIQCLRLLDAPVYAAQFHIEMAGTPEVSRRIMENFLGEARAWQARRAYRER
jgi:GMP synthase-like glutamine amidotransferase